MASIHPLRQESSEPTPLNARAEANLRFIRETMERASSFTDVPGWGLVAMGLTALVAAGCSAVQNEPRTWLLVWLVEATLAIGIAMTTMAAKARANGQSLVKGPGRKFLLSFLPPCVAGAFLTIVLVQAGLWHVLPGAWLLLYGTGVVTGGAFSVKSVPVMGLCFMALGVVAFFGPAGWGSAWMALGFGATHVVFGIEIARRHGG